MMKDNDDQQEYALGQEAALQLYFRVRSLFLVSTNSFLFMFFSLVCILCLKQAHFQFEEPSLKQQFKYTPGKGRDADTLAGSVVYVVFKLGPVEGEITKLYFISEKHKYHQKSCTHICTNGVKKISVTQSKYRQLVKANKLCKTCQLDVIAQQSSAALCPR